MTPEERRAFLESHRLCIVGYGRRGKPPAMTPVYYVLDGDDILISTTASRAKARVIRRHPQVSLCILHEQFPFPYLTVYGRGQIEEGGVVDLMMRVGEVMGRAPTPDARAATAERAAREGRVVLRVTPEDYAEGGQRPQPPAAR
jgi:PPOX class probable F420-dependent enzyme